MEEIKGAACPDISRYAKLMEALKKAKKAALESIRKDDGGSSNLDYTMLLMEGNRVAIMKAIEQAGLTGSASMEEHSEYHIHVPDVRWQGFNRARQAEAMAKSLKESRFTANYVQVID
jgi:hypothetical protein